MSMFRVALYEPEIPANTGNISRLCVGTECELILIGALGFSLDDARLRRAGLDHWHALRLSRVPSLDEILQQDRVAIFTRRGRRPHWMHAFRENDILLFGCETRGLPLDVLEKHRERTFALPMPGPVRSVNLANTVAVVVYEGLRQLAGRGMPVFLQKPEGPESFDIRA